MSSNGFAGLSWYVWAGIILAIALIIIGAVLQMNGS